MIAALLGWGVHYLRHVRRIEKIVAHLDEHGGFVEYGDTTVFGHSVDANRIPECIWQNLGEAAFRDVEAVSLDGEGYTAATDTEFALLNELPALREVEIAGDLTTANAMDSLATLPNLRTIRFRNSPVTDARLSALKHARGLESLELYDDLVRPYSPAYDDQALEGLAEIRQLRSLQLVLTFGITADGVARLGELRNLRALKLTGANNASRDSRLESLPQLSQLKQLELHSFRVTEAGFQRIGEWKHLQSASFTNCRLPENSVAILKSLPNLRELRFVHTPLSPVLLRDLHSLRQLEHLDVGMGISDAGLDELRRALPDCSIKRFGGSVFSGGSYLP